MTQWVLKANGNVVPWHTTRPLSVDKRHSPLEIKKRETFNSLIERKWGMVISSPQLSTINDGQWEVYEDDKESPRHITEIEDIFNATRKVFSQQPVYGRIINAEIIL